MILNISRDARHYQSFVTIDRRENLNGLWNYATSDHKLCIERTNVIFKEIHTKTKQAIRFQGSFKVTNQIEGKWKAKRPFLDISKIYRVNLTPSVNLEIQLDFHPQAKLNLF